MRTVINDSEEFQTALIYPQRAKLRRGVSPHWRTVAIVGWSVVIILTAISARSEDLAGRDDLALREPTRRPDSGRCVQRTLSDPTTAPVPGVHLATEHHLAGCPPPLTARRHRGFKLSSAVSGGGRKPRNAPCRSGG